MRYLFAFSLLTVVISACQPELKSGTPQESPNIIFILTDDLGYGDIGAFYQNQRAEEGEPHHKTPHLDKMAHEGVRLTRHYVGAPVCAPSRASLLLGVHQGHAEIRDNQFDKALPDNHTLASVMKEAGYATGIVGKYGLQGLDGNSPETWKAYPTKRGFDHFFGYVRHRDGHNHYPAHEVRERPKVELYSGETEISSKLKGAYTTDLFTAAAKKWIIDQEENNAERPFFLYLAYDTPHAGLEVAPTPYPEGGGLDGGIQWIGEEGNFINSIDGSIDDYFHPDYQNQNWPEPQKRFASMVRRIDNGVGDLMQLLKDLNIDDNTIIVFSSDNGAHRESYGYGDYSPTFLDSFGPLDGIKRDTWEGGIRVPTIVRWPAQVPAGTEVDSPSGFHDWMPTFAELAGVPAPARTDGVSLLPILTGSDEPHAGEVYIEYSQGGRTPDYAEFDPSHRDQVREQMQVIYVDGYKGVRYDAVSAGDDFRIYDTQEDPGEVNNLAGSNDQFEILQQRMKDAVLRMRRPDSTAVRPYDEEPMPAVEPPTELNKGLRYQVFEEVTPWTPDITTLQQPPTQSGTTDEINLNMIKGDDNIVVSYTGFLEVPKTGEYSFSLQTDRGAVLRLHRATVIDADKGYNANTIVSSKVHLAEGLHPIHLTYVRSQEGPHSLELQWDGPEFSRQKIKADQLFN